MMKKQQYILVNNNLRNQGNKYVIGDATEIAKIVTEVDWRGIDYCIYKLGAEVQIEVSVNIKDISRTRAVDAAEYEISGPKKWF